MIYDLLYLSGLLITWAGNLKQTYHTWQTKSTRSFSLAWLGALLVSFGLRLPRAFASEFWVWKVGYVISAVILATMVGLVFYYRRKNGKEN